MGSPPTSAPADEAEPTPGPPPMEPLTPSAFERVENPTAWRRWREAIANGRPIRPCGCPADDPHESHCSWYLRWIPD